LVVVLDGPWQEACLYRRRRTSTAISRAPFNEARLPPPKPGSARGLGSVSPARGSFDVHNGG